MDLPQYLVVDQEDGNKAVLRRDWRDALHFAGLLIASYAKEEDLPNIVIVDLEASGGPKQYETEELISILDENRGHWAEAETP